MVFAFFFNFYKSFGILFVLVFSRFVGIFAFLLVQESWNVVFSLDGHVTRSHHAWFFEDALTSDTAKYQTLRLLIFFTNESLPKS